MNIGNFLKGVVNALSQVAQAPARTAQSVGRFFGGTPSNIAGMKSFYGDEPASLPTSPARAMGNVAVQGAAQRQGYTPSFLQTVMRTNPVVVPNLNPMLAAGLYVPKINQIRLSSTQGINPSTITHEGLHADWRKLQPEAKQKFQSFLNQATPQQKNIIGQILGTPMYNKRGSQSDLNEARSYLSQYNQADQSPALSQYYKNYYSNPRFETPQIQNLDKYINYNVPRYGLPRQPQKSFWTDY